MKTVLFLCSGNTCRSPMAACLFNHICQERGLPFRGISAGLSALDGSPASEGAYAAMKAQGLSLLGHRAQSLTRNVIEEADMIMAVSQGHADVCRERFSDLLLPIRVFSPAIPDPYQASTAVYLQTAAAMQPQILALAEALS